MTSGAFLRTVLSMDRERALERLPQAYALALSLADGGAEPETIAVALHIDLTEASGLLARAEAELARLVDGTPS